MGEVQIQESGKDQRRVVGSNPTRGAAIKQILKEISLRRCETG